MIPIVALLLGAFLALPALALANGGPAEWAGNEYGGTLVSVQDEAIAVLGERLTIDFAAVGDADPMRSVPITATYRLRNGAAEARTVLVAFPFWWQAHHGYSPFVDFEPQVKAALDGAPLVVQRAASLQEDLPAALAGAGWRIPPEAAPAGEGLLRDLQAYGPPPASGTAGSEPSWRLRAVAFTVTLAAGAEGVLEVSYPQHAGLSLRDPRWANMRQIDYILQTARYWKDFHDLEVEVRVPHGLDVAANLPLSLVASDDVDRYTFRSPTLPATNLRVAVGEPLSVDRVVLRYLGRGNERIGRDTLLILLFAAAILGAWLAAARYGDREARRAGHFGR